jgi:preprotein translocase subunit SecG
MCAHGVRLADSQGVAVTWSTANKIGLALQLLYGVVNLPTAFMEPETGDMAGPPTWVLWADTILAVVLIIAIVLAWRNRSHGAAVVGSAANALISASGIPAFFVEVPTAIKILVAAGIVWTIVSVGLTFAGKKALPA